MFPNRTAPEPPPMILLLDAFAAVSALLVLAYTSCRPGPRKRK